MSPPVGISSPAIMRSTVVLPPPLGPSNAISSPSLTENVTLWTAATSPNFLETFLSSMAIGSVFTALPRQESRVGLAFRPGRRRLLRQRVVAGLLPFEQRLEPKRHQRQQRQQTGDGECGGRIVFVVIFLD